jgi:hypothetical protein
MCLALATPIHAETITAARDQLVTGIAVVGAAIVVLVVIFVHRSHNKAIVTGCLSATAGGVSFTDEKDRRVYGLLGNPPGAQPGERMTLEGKRTKVNRMPFFEARGVIKDLGPCQNPS